MTRSRTLLLFLLAIVVALAPVPDARADDGRFTSADVSSFVRAAAKAGIPTYRPGSSKPVVRVRGRLSPVRLTTELAQSAALGAWGQAGMTAGQLDEMTGPVAIGSVQLPTGALVAAWAKSTDSASARLARQILGPVDWPRYQEIVLPSAVLLLFASDVALHMPQRGGAAPRAAAVTARAAAAGVPAGPCTAVQDFVEQTIKRIFASFGRLQTDHAAIKKFAGSFLGSIIGAVGDALSFTVNTAVDAGRTFVLGAVRIPVKLVTEAIAGVAATVSVIGEITNMLMPWSGKVSIDRNPTSKAFGAGVPGLLTLKVTAPGSNLKWPGWLQNCASLFDFPLPTTTPKDQPVEWDLRNQSPAGLVTPGAPSGPLDARGIATQPFVTGEETPEVASGPEREGRVDVVATVHRTDLDPYVERINRGFLRLLPALVRDMVGKQISAVIQPMLASLRRRIGKVRDVTAKAHFTVLYHDPPEKKKEQPAAPPAPPTIGGHWDGQWSGEGSGTWSADFKQEGNAFSGTIVINNSNCVHGGRISGTIEGDQIKFGVVEAEQRISFSGTLSGDTMSGTWSKPAAADPCKANGGTFSATRAK